jgi:hypothetical protein
MRKASKYEATLITRDGSTQKKWMPMPPREYIEIPMAPQLSYVPETGDLLESVPVHVRVFERYRTRGMGDTGFAPPSTTIPPWWRLEVEYREVANTDESADWNLPQWWVKRYEELAGEAASASAELFKANEKIDRLEHDKKMMFASINTLETEYLLEERRSRKLLKRIAAAEKELRP